jgi:spermidine/putrescine transport system ATP-binding protein
MANLSPAVVGTAALEHDGAVVLRDVVKTFPTAGGAPFAAVDHVSLDILDGEFFSMLGPSGCGKSTTLRMIAGFETPTSGSIAIQGREMRDVQPYSRPVNMVFQSYALFPHLTVGQNLAFGLEMKHVDKAEISRRVGAALELVRLPGMLDRRPGQLSGGQQQRVALARALINQPAVLLLDEPLGALDMKLRKEMQLELKQLQQQVGITFVYVTHDQEEALTMSDRIAVMNEGRALQIGLPTEIYERPNCQFVADFIGEANFLTGRVTSIDSGEVTVAVNDESMMVRGIAPDVVVIGQAVTISVRPEKLFLTTVAPPADRNAFPATVEDVTYIGSDTRVRLRLGPSLVLIAWEQNDLSTLDPDAYYHRGEAVWVSWPPDNALVLGR